MPRVPQGRVTLGGYTHQGQERWTMSFAVDPLDQRSQGQIDTLADRIEEVFYNEVWNDPDVKIFIPASVAFDSVRVDDVQEPGGIVRTATFTRTEPALGAFANQQLPSQCAVVISLLTGAPGASRRGRMYFPPIGVNATTINGELAPGSQLALADAFGRFFTQINGLSDLALTAFVASDKLQQLTAISSVRVGSIIDTQRRRRNELLEAYVAAAVL